MILKFGLSFRYTYSILQKQPLEVVCKKDVLKHFAIFTGKHLCQSLFFNKVPTVSLQLFKKDNLVQVLCRKFCEIFKSTYFIEYLWFYGIWHEFLIPKLETNWISAYVTATGFLEYLLPGDNFPGKFVSKLFFPSKLPLGSKYCLNFLVNRNE